MLSIHEYVYFKFTLHRLGLIYNSKISFWLIKLLPAKKEIWVYKDQHHYHGFYRYCCSSYHVRKLFNVCYIIIETFLISFHTFPPYQNTNYTHHHQHFLYSNEKLLWIVAADSGVNTILNECVQICCYKRSWIKSFFTFFSSLLFLSICSAGFARNILINFATAAIYANVEKHNEQQIVLR